MSINGLSVLKKYAGKADKQDYYILHLAWQQLEVNFGVIKFSKDQHKKIISQFQDTELLSQS